MCDVGNRLPKAAVRRWHAGQRQRQRPQLCPGEGYSAAPAQIKLMAFSARTAGHLRLEDAERGGALHDGGQSQGPRDALAAPSVEGGSGTKIPHLERANTPGEGKRAESMSIIKGTCGSWCPGRNRTTDTVIFSPNMRNEALKFQ